MPERLLLQDACVLINLVASGRFEDIARHCGFQFAVASAVCAEVHFTRDNATGEIVPINLDPYFATALLEKLEIETEAERTAYITFAAQRLDDGEAMSLALADVRHLALATDDRKARLLVVRENLTVELQSTVSLLQRWEGNCSISGEEMRQVLTQIRDCARFIPRPSTPEHAWWVQRLNV